MDYAKVFNKTDYRILEELICNECYSSYISLSVKDLIAKTNLSHVKIRQSLKNFIGFGFVREGNKNRNSKTYYITQEGINNYKEAFNYDDADINTVIDSYSKIQDEQEDI